jgi:alkaline phosphatase
MKSSYVDGFLLVVPKGKAAEYKKMAEWGKKLWMKHGALDYKECMGDDVTPKGPMPGIKQLHFPTVIKAKKGETVWFSFIVFKSRKHRDEVNAKVMKDPAMNDDTWKDKPMPMDMKRFAYGGFKVEVGV